VLEAADGHEALRLARTYRHNIDLLLTDVVMPQMSGRALADTLATMYPDAKILFASGYTDGAIAQHGVLDADTQFIQKPFSPTQLANKVRQVLDNS
jgi:YesN/AraC family two-component response regulator